MSADSLPDVSVSVSTGEPPVAGPLVEPLAGAPPPSASASSSSSSSLAAGDMPTPGAGNIAPAASASPPPTQDPPSGSNTGTGTGTGTRTGSVVVRFDVPAAHIWTVDDLASPPGPTIKLFQWSRANESVSLTRITWSARAPSALDFDASSPVIDDLDLPLNSSAPSLGGAIQSATNSSARLVLSSPPAAQYRWWTMAITLHWQTDLAVGLSRSAIFTVGDSLNASARAAFLAQDMTSRAALGFDQVLSPRADAANATSPISSSRNPPPPPGSSSGSIASSRAGLSRAAKAGIGAACGIVALALLVALVYLVILRRRRQRQNPRRASGRVEDGAGKPSMAEDSSTAALPVGGAGSSHEAVALRPRGPDDDADADADAESSRPINRASGHEGEGGGLPRGVSRHLVEEGMTREDILRLEEEERHLDAEIERAVRRG